jgi:hypothetical protein
MTHQKSPSPDSTPGSSERPPSDAATLGGRQAADRARRKRSIVQWILLIAILILPW